MKGIPEWILLGAAGLTLSALVEWSRRAWPRRRARVLPQRIAAGARPVLPAVGGPDQAPRRGRIFADGDFLCFVPWRGRRLLLPLEATLGQPTLRSYDEEHDELSARVVYRDERERRYAVGVTQVYEPALAALRATPARPASGWTRVRAGLPLSLLALVLLLSVPAAAFHVVWWSGHEVSARVTAVTPVPDDPELFGCTVSWVDGARAQRATVDCPEPLPGVGSSTPVRALAWPLRGQALDEAGIFDFLGILLPAATALVLLAGLVWSAVRGRRPAVTLTPVRDARSIRNGDDAHSGAVSVAPDRLRWASMRALALELAAVQGAPERRDGPGDASAEPDGAPDDTPSWWRDLRTAVPGSGWWWPVLPVLAWGFLVDVEPGAAPVPALAAWLPWFAWAALAVAVALLLWRVTVIVQLLRRLRGAWHQPFGPTWDYVSFHSLGQESVVLLLEGDSARWVVVMKDTVPASGTLRLRGEVSAGGVVHTLIGGRVRVPLGPLVAVDRAVRDDLREELVLALTGEAEQDRG